MTAVALSGGGRCSSIPGTLAGHHLRLFQPWIEGSPAIVVSANPPLELALLNAAAGFVTKRSQFGTAPGEAPMLRLISRIAWRSNCAHFPRERISLGHEPWLIKGLQQEPSSPCEVYSL